MQAFSTFGDDLNDWRLFRALTLPTFIMEHWWLQRLVLVSQCTQYRLRLTHGDYLGRLDFADWRARLKSYVVDLMLAFSRWLVWVVWVGNHAHLHKQFQCLLVNIASTMIAIMHRRLEVATRVLPSVRWRICANRCNEAWADGSFWRLQLRWAPILDLSSEWLWIFAETHRVCVVGHVLTDRLGPRSRVSSCGWIRGDLAQDWLIVGCGLLKNAQVITVKGL